MLKIWFIGFIASVILTGIYCERNSVDVSQATPRIFLRAAWWPLSVVYSACWGVAVFFSFLFQTTIRWRNV